MSYVLKTISINSSNFLRPIRTSRFNGLMRAAAAWDTEAEATRTSGATQEKAPLKPEDGRSAGPSVLAGHVHACPHATAYVLQNTRLSGSMSETLTSRANLNWGGKCIFSNLWVKTFKAQVSFSGGKSWLQKCKDTAQSRRWQARASPCMTATPWKPQGCDPAIKMNVLAGETASHDGWRWCPLLMRLLMTFHFVTI